MRRVPWAYCLGSSLIVLVCSLCACGPKAPMSVSPPREPRPSLVRDIHQTGVASIYADRLHGKKTASGERYDKNDLTCSHRTLPLNTYLHVTNCHNGRAVVVRVNDRGPFHKKRLVDLSKAAAKRLDFVHKGLTSVRIRTAHAHEIPN